MEKITNFNKQVKDRDIITLVNENETTKYEFIMDEPDDFSCAVLYNIDTNEMVWMQKSKIENSNFYYGD